MKYMVKGPKYSLDANLFLVNIKQARQAATIVALMSILSTVNKFLLQT